MSTKEITVKIRLKEALEEAKMSISELSRKTKLERKSIYNIINQESDPNICTLVKIAKALNLKIENLIEY